MGAIACTDQKVREYICNKIKQSIPTISIILAGSRARGDHHDDSDYDIVIVMSTPLIPIFLRRIKRLEGDLVVTLGVDINLRPLPSWRLLKPSNNPYILKMRRDGIVLSGRDFFKEAGVKVQEQMGAYWCFYHLFSVSRVLIEPFQPKKRDDTCLALAVAKGMRELWDSPLVNYSLGNVSDFLERFERVRNKTLLTRWFVVRDILLKLFEELIKFTLKTERIENFGSDYLRASRNWKHTLKNIQFVFLVLLFRRELRLKPLLHKPSVTHKMGLATMLLLKSVNEDASIDADCVNMAYKLLVDCTGAKYSEDSLVLWTELKKKVLSYWPYAMTTMGF